MVGWAESPRERRRRARAETPRERRRRASGVAQGGPAVRERDACSSAPRAVASSSDETRTGWSQASRSVREVGGEPLPFSDTPAEAQLTRIEIDAPLANHSDPTLAGCRSPCMQLAMASRRSRYCIGEGGGRQIRGTPPAYATVLLESY